MRVPLARLALRPVAAVVNFALPPRCAGCGEIVDRVGQFCAPCWGAVAWLGEGCETCGQPLLPGEEKGCGPCLIGKAQPLDRRRAASGYGEISRQIALQLKYGRKIGHARIMADAMRPRLMKALETLDEGDKALMMPVPLHRLRIWGRGFNQAMLIAKALARGEKERVELVPDLMLRTRRTQPLKAMTHNERRREVAGAFALHPRHAGRVRDRNILIIDDVVTSGGTAGACAKALKAAGARRVELIAWTMVVHPDRLVR